MNKILTTLMIVAIFSIASPHTFAAPIKPLDLIENGAGKSGVIPPGLLHTKNTHPHDKLMISNVQATSITSSSAVITWDTNKLSSSQVTYWNSASSSKKSLISVVSTTTESLNHIIFLDGLTARTSYTYFVGSVDTSDKSKNGHGQDHEKDDKKGHGQDHEKDYGKSHKKTFTTLGLPGTGQDDVVGPWISVLSITPTSTDPGGQVTFTVTAQDPSGIGNVTFDIRYPNSAYVLSPNCNFFGATSGTCTFTESIDHGISPTILGNYVIESLSANDLLNNISTYYPDGTVTGAQEPTHALNIPIVRIQAPLAISNVYATSTSDSRAVITWETNKDARGTVFYWIPPNSDSPGAPTVLSASETSPTMSHEIVLTGLSARTPYVYYVMSEDSSGNRVSSAEYTFTTRAFVPPPPPRQPILGPLYLGIVVNTDGNYYVTGFSGGSAALGIIAPTTGNTRVLASGGNLAQSMLTEVAIDTNGDIIANENKNRSGGGNRIIKIDSTTGIQTTITENTSPLITQGDIAFDNNNNILLVGNETVSRINPVTGIQTVLFTLPEHYIRGIVYEHSTGELIARSSTGSGEVLLRINLSTGATSIITSGGNLVNPRDLVIDANGDYIILEALLTGASVVKINRSTGAQSIISHIAGTQTSAADIALESDGTILVLSHVNGLVKVNPITGSQQKLDFELQ